MSEFVIDLDELAKQAIELRHEESRESFKRWILESPDTPERKEELCFILIAIVETVEQLGFAEGYKAAVEAISNFHGKVIDD